jgi:hypothetical protein
MRPSLHTTAVALLFSLQLTGCDQAARVAELQQLKRQVSFNELFRDVEGVAYLTPDADGYAVITSDLGSLMVSLKNIQPNANGSKVTLQFGNVTAATIDGLKAKIEWSAMTKEGVHNNKEAKSREVTINEALQFAAPAPTAAVGVPDDDGGDHGPS